jgi:hypothetical protein
MVSAALLPVKESTVPIGWLGLGVSESRARRAKSFVSAGNRTVEPPLICAAKSLYSTLILNFEHCTFFNFKCDHRPLSPKFWGIFCPQLFEACTLEYKYMTSIAVMLIRCVGRTLDAVQLFGLPVDSSASQYHRGSPALQVVHLLYFCIWRINVF